MYPASYGSDLINSYVCITQIVGMVENKNEIANWVYEPTSPLTFQSLLYVIDGEALIYMNEKEYRIKKNMVVFRRKGDTYRSRGLKKNFWYIEVAFDTPVHFDLRYPSQRVYKVTRPSLFYDLFRAMQTVWNQRTFGYQIKATSILMNIFYQLLPEYFSDKEPSKGYNTIKASIEYMNQNYFNSDLTIENIAKQSNLTSSRFRSLFKEIYGISPLQHINATRIEKAKSLLQISNHTVARIASEVGFPDAHHFSKLFKKMVGISPKEYREENTVQ